ncbi:ABC transporter substrate-binding protein [Pararhizobium mangrovi]|uniref:ABC transporter substrate-binding protein n=1 Tax=Pararhizobium mangrovi TaxID=2590452 RepID=A0A506UFX3_9HYPH|nr:ABC transporter substrate-binding protein [Pararhizobium mangrovi]TPW31975.1 ABC transporter substrate-binding protein [Pararhizobium mangrovi]
MKNVLFDFLTKAETGRMSRRDFTKAVGAALALPVAMRSTLSFAQAKQLVLCNWGGDAIDAYTDAYGKPFQEKTGMPVKMDGSGPTEGAITAQAKSGNVTWDIVDVDPFTAITLGKKGYMRKIDYDKIDKSKIRDGFLWDYALSSYFFSYVICYDSSLYPEAPTGMADFFDTDKFRGNRTMYKWGVSSWEAALLADGVAPKDLYPLDLDRANKKLKSFLPNVISFWGGGAESQTAMLTGEAPMGIVWSTRARLIEKASGGRIKYIWDEGLLSPGAFGVMANNPAGREAAMDFLASTQDPERQLVMFKMLTQGPANPAADPLIPADLKRHDCVAPENMEKQITLDMQWYADHYSKALDNYLAIISA